MPRTNTTDANNLPDIDIDKVPLDASTQETVQAIEPSPMINGTGDSPFNKDNTKGNENEKPPHRHLSKIISLFKGNAKSTVESKLAFDHVRAAAGSHKAQGHLGVLPKPKNLIYAGPAVFKARFEGKKGWLYITNTASSSSEGSRLLFMTDDPRNRDDGIEASREEKMFSWSITLQDIHRMKRATAFASKPAEMAAGWSEDTELLGSLEIDDAEEHTWRFTALPERDALFNRLIALGGQRWENM